MDSEKIENLLNLSLNATAEERDKSPELNVGYDKETKTWELIVKYHGDLMSISGELIHVELLTEGYAIVTIPENLIDEFAALEYVEYIEKPKRLFFSLLEGKRASCILPVTLRLPFLSGKDVLVAVIDSGIDYTHRDFRHADGTTRIISLWDQTVAPDIEKGFYPPSGFEIGTEFSFEQINEALRQPTRAETMALVPSRDISGHGTAVTGIAAGNGAESDGLYEGVAPNSELLIVKLGQANAEGFPRTTELMRALAYVVKKSISLLRPVAINLSFGNTYGAHNGASLLERYIDNIAEIGKNVICVGSGNEGASAGHVAGRLNNTSIVELAVAPYETSLSVQLWKNYADLFRVFLISPGGSQTEIDISKEGTQTIVLDDTTLLIYSGDPKPYATNQEIYIDFIPVGSYITSGVWSIRMEPVRIVRGDYYFYLPSAVTRNANTGFFRPTPDVTLTIPSTAAKVITVGAYDVIYDAYADFSGRGFAGIQNTVIEAGGGGIKPTLAAPGVNITSASTMNGYSTFTGTSFATPFVTGSAALMMEWGIVMGNDPYLYGEKIKAYLIRGARHLPGFESFPNAQVGYGALCLEDSLPL